MFYCKGAAAATVSGRHPSGHRTPFFLVVPGNPSLDPRVDLLPITHGTVSSTKHALHPRSSDAFARLAGLSLLTIFVAPPRRIVESKTNK